LSAAFQRTTPLKPALHVHVAPAPDPLASAGQGTGLHEPPPWASATRAHAGACAEHAKRTPPEKPSLQGTTTSSSNSGILDPTAVAAAALESPAVRWRGDAGTSPSHRARRHSPNHAPNGPELSGDEPDPLPLAGVTLHSSVE
jgi:hypothetical protein